ncbi:MAG: acyl-CoA dehydratase activase-related protein [Fusobacterium sp.]|uniref:acyl-CoA dehydratase activase-related protein n=1 Tax=Fusobacterium sp. TaxID=68766 RepID=UPI0029437453|nr:acyl-CoA dehydratase activase-related protein [Fusobacterium sp.]MDY3060401.1 acyl-CoA dehydratase activase-related protein [Fusobacterium sp.]
MKKFYVGIDVGSTTIKIVCLNEENSIIYSIYQRHLSNVRETAKIIFDNFLKELKGKYGDDIQCKVSITGSSGMGIASWINLDFVQEVIACIKSIETFIPETDVAIELGGEDAKITFLKNDMDQRMNGSCAGGTGAFIDQIASLLNTDASGLNELAKGFDTIYPIAARCGVFAKTDIQPLINEGVKKENIAVSVLQAVVNQTITGLACGKKITGKVAFLGGPLFFLSELRNRFIDTLKLTDKDIIFPENSQLFVAQGAALLSKENSNFFTVEELEKKFQRLNEKDTSDTTRLQPLFKDEEELKEFYTRHEKEKIDTVDLATYKGNAYLGIDAGSTTIKVVLISENSEILYSHYSHNKGNPLENIITTLKELYSKLSKDITIKSSCVTGYGEALIKAALKVDIGIVETMAHYKGAQFFQPNVDFILDIGGQDMKCLKIEDGVITSILLNEACSSGCGSFLETFANSLGMDIIEFSKKGLEAKAPADLGTRCTVFMNSKVKQAQKDGVEVGDISAGLSYSVVKNTLFKVIKIKNKEELGKYIVVQGGTFLNDCVLRAFELVSDRDVIRPNIAGLMGAFGAALIAKEENIEKSTLLNLDELNDFYCTTNLTRCKMCTNHCLLTIHKFKNGERFISGNRCDNPLGKLKKNSAPNMYEYKYNRLFSYVPLEPSQAPRGEIGIPRVLNIYDSYPFWFTLLTALGFRVVISDDSSKKLYEKGIDTITSDSICYPAKLVHGHIINLIEKGIKRIFYPCVIFEEKEDKNSQNQFNCPIVMSYPEVIKNNLDILKEKHIDMMIPFFSFESKEILKKTILEEFEKFDVSEEEVKNALDLAWEERLNFRKDLKNKALEIIKDLEKTGKTGVVLCGRPYHCDKEIHHGIPNIINSFGIAVLTGDAVASISSLDEELRVVDQWTYHSRLYRAAAYVGKSNCLELIELNSFSCGIDAVTTDQVAEILANHGKVHTLLKIDEISNLGAVKIRIRSLLAALDYKKKVLKKSIKKKIEYKKAKFTKNMKKDYTILAPQMAPMHFNLISVAFKKEGYNLEILPETKEALDYGLQYVNNDACYPSILVIGELISALKSGKYDLDRTAVMISQTGGSCRATNYLGFLKKAIKDSGFEKVPILSLNANGFEKQEGFKITPALAHRCLLAVSYGDILMKLLYHTRPYEINKGESEKLYNTWNERVKINIQNGSFFEYKRNITNIIEDFSNIKTSSEKKVKVGIVGEILVKFSPFANNNLAEFIEQEGGEVYTSSLMNFIKYCIFSDIFITERFKGKFSALKLKIALWVIDRYTKVIDNALRKNKKFGNDESIETLAKKTSKYISIGNQSGEGWFLMGEMIEFIEKGVPNIVCVQPFGCLPNHITGKGMIKKLREEYSDKFVNIAPIDYDPAYSEVNQLNRIKLMLSVAKKNLKNS